MVPTLRIAIFRCFDVSILRFSDISIFQHADDFRCFDRQGLDSGERRGSMCANLLVFMRYVNVSMLQYSDYFVSPDASIFPTIFDVPMFQYSDFFRMFPSSGPGQRRSTFFFDMCNFAICDVSIFCVDVSMFQYYDKSYGSMFQYSDNNCGSIIR